MTIIQSIWYKLYPTDHEHKWMPLIWLPFMIWFFVIHGPGSSVFSGQSGI